LNVIHSPLPEGLQYHNFAIKKMANILFEYLFRDEGNYKTYGEVVFANHL